MAPQSHGNTRGWRRPVAGSSWHWQLSGEVDESVPAQVYDVDGFEQSADLVARLQQRGRYVVAYFSAGAWEKWRPDRDRFPRELRGKRNGWPGERWLDVRALAVLRPALEARADLAAAKGFDAVEWDNVDGCENATGFPISHGDQLAFDRMLAEICHARGLAVFLKNCAEHATELEPHFDGLVVEEAHRYREVDAYRAFDAAGKPVLAAEYPLETGSSPQLTAAQKADADARGWALAAFPIDLDGPRLDTNTAVDGPCRVVHVPG